MKKVKAGLLAAFEGLKKVPSLVAVGLITFYRWVISPLTPSSCRFYPTCSEYGLEAFRRFGFFKGFLLTAKRISRCRPGGPYGYDPVPEKGTKSDPVPSGFVIEGETKVCGK